jgi:hypothetical protein
MNDREKFLFDLQGFLKVEGFLSADEVRAFNDAFDANSESRVDDPNHHPEGNTYGPKRRGMFTGMLTWDQPHCQPFRDLLAHPKSIPYLNTLFGRGWKMDHAPFMLTGGRGTEGLVSRGDVSPLRRRPVLHLPQRPDALWHDRLPVPADGCE